MNIELSEAKNWWHNNLSINEQKSLAKKHLIEGIDYELLMGHYSNYSTAKQYNALIKKIWDIEGKPEGLKPNGFIWTIE